MKKYPSIRASETPPDPRRRELLLAALAGSAGLAWSGGRQEKESACLLSLREADFYARHELAG